MVDIFPRTSGGIALVRFCAVVCKDVGYAVIVLIDFFFLFNLFEVAIAGAENKRAEDCREYGGSENRDFGVIVIAGADAER